MDIAQLVLTALVAALGGGGLTYLLFYKQERARRVADTSKIIADAAKVVAETDLLQQDILKQIIDVLRNGYDRLADKTDKLEMRVAALEAENLTLKGTVDGLKRLVRQLWEIIRDNGLATDPALIASVFAALGGDGESGG